MPFYMLPSQDILNQKHFTFIKTELYIIKEKKTSKTWKEKYQTKMNCNIDFARINGFCNINIEKPLLH